MRQQSFVGCLVMRHACLDTQSAASQIVLPENTPVFGQRIPVSRGRTTRDAQKAAVEMGDCDQIFW